MNQRFCVRVKKFAARTCILNFFVAEMFQHTC